MSLLGVVVAIVVGTTFFFGVLAIFGMIESEPHGRTQAVWSDAVADGPDGSSLGAGAAAQTPPSATE